MTAATCYDCQGRFDRDTMHLIKADTLNGRALICDSCHLAEVEHSVMVSEPEMRERMGREFNRRLAARDRAVKAEAWDECMDYVSRHYEDYLPAGWSGEVDSANPYRKGADA